MAYRDLVLQDSPLAYWRLSDSLGSLALDESGGLHGEYQGGAISEQPGALADGDSAVAVFNSQDPDPITNTDRVHAAGVFTLGTAWTLEAWFKQTVAGDGIFLSLGLPYIAVDSAGRPLLSWTDSSGVQRTLIGSSPRTVLGQWNHVVGCHDGTTARVYVNGVESISTQQWDSKIVEQLVCDIGAHQNVSGRSLNGLVDEAALYARVLTPSRVLSHYMARLEPAAPSIASAGVVEATEETGRFRVAEEWYTCGRCGRNFPRSKVIVQNGLIVCVGSGTTMCFDEPGRDHYTRRLDIPREHEIPPLPQVETE